ncbi:erythritol/L-threitol dehydrogenase, partial [Klebsiella pneumoniae]|jgi:threonine dehydrogenase-like Zn-dependent dehydrogenase|nr:erythritol/L-threitol dehydrogenase [Klebsiella pneumoniae]
VIEGIANGDLPTEGVVTHTLPLEQFAEGFELMKRGIGSIKVVLNPNL